MSKSVKFVKIITPIAFAIALSACGGGSSSFLEKSENLDPGEGTGSAEELVYTMQPLQISLATLSAGGNTGLTTRLLDQNGDLATEEFSISFTSPCVSDGTSKVVSPVVSSNGVFTSSYTAIGCEGDDKITAAVDGLSVDGTINVQAADLGAVEFISAEPQNILLDGMSAPGFGHTSTVKFQIRNKAGGPVANEDVRFELTTDVGGITLASTVGKTDNDGFVSTILHAGTVHTPVRVRAIVERDDVSLSSESSQLVISTGIADQNSLSISLSVLNPSAWDYDGEKVSVNMYASDRYNNPVPDGTTVAFYTELGQIEPSCQTENGACVVEWTSTDPRDLGTLDPLYPRDSSSSNSDGITTITAVVIGEESFIDTNSNGIFDGGDQLDLKSDRGEAFEDYNMQYDTNTPRDNVSDNQHDDGLEPYLDFDKNGMRDPKDNLYTGLGCEHETLCASDEGLKNIFTSIELVMAESHQNVRVWEGGIGGILVNTIRNGVPYFIEVSGVTNNQVPPAGTTISTASDEADVIAGSATVGSTNGHNNNLTSPAGNYGVGLFVGDSDPEERKDGYVEITVTTPKGQAVNHIYQYQDDDVVEPDPETPISSDSDAPILTLNGLPEITIDLDTVYNDLGANATDAVDGTVPVVILGNVNHSALGTYTLIYIATDIAGNSSSVTRTVIVAPADTAEPEEPPVGVVLGSVEYIGASPQTILLQGMSAPGLEHTSTVTFQVKDDVGEPIVDQDVTFSLTTSVGGTRLTAVSAKTDSQGVATAKLQAGTVHTSVRVRASVELGGKEISSESSQVIISTGIADQNSLSLSVSTHNPSGWDYDGEKVSINMLASDRYNNPVPDGTTVAFYTELGQIEPHCQTSGGACTVEWTSSNPKELGTTDPRYIHNGVTTITAAVIGEESFIDTNSNGIFDDGDQLDNISDRGEAFEDYNKDGIHDDGLEPYLDFNADGIRNPSDGLYTGLGCESTTLCAAGSNLKDIYTSIEVVLAENDQNLVVKDLAGNEVTVIENGIDYILEISGNENGQVPPEGTVIVPSSDDAEIETSPVTVHSTNNSGAFIASLRVKNKLLDPDDLINPVLEYGLIKISITTPKGIVKEFFLTYHNDTVAP